MTAAELNDLESPPPSPFTVDVTVTMTNDEGETASGTITFRTEYDRESDTALPGEPEGPSFSETETRIAPPGVALYVTADNSFNNVGTNPRITEAEFSTTAYYSIHQVTNGIAWLQPMTAAELNDLESPPPSPFTVDVTVTMTNDEGETASGTITFRTEYDRDAPTATPLLSDPGATED